MKKGNVMQKVILAIIGLAFALAITSCVDQGKKTDDMQKGADKERHERVW